MMARGKERPKDKPAEPNPLAEALLEGLRQEDEDAEDDRFARQANAISAEDMFDLGPREEDDA